MVRKQNKTKPEIEVSRASREGAHRPVLTLTDGRKSKQFSSILATEKGELLFSKETTYSR